MLRSELGGGVVEVDILEYLGRLAVELIAQAGLGYTFHALEGGSNDYANALKAYVYVVRTVCVLGLAC